MLAPMTHVARYLAPEKVNMLRKTCRDLAAIPPPSFYLSDQWKLFVKTRADFCRKIRWLSMCDTIGVRWDPPESSQTRMRVLFEKLPRFAKTAHERRLLYADMNCPHWRKSLSNHR